LEGLYSNGSATPMQSRPFRRRKWDFVPPERQQRPVSERTTECSRAWNRSKCRDGSQHTIASRHEKLEQTEVKRQRKHCMRMVRSEAPTLPMEAREDPGTFKVRTNATRGMHTVKARILRAYRALENAQGEAPHNAQHSKIGVKYQDLCVMLAKSPSGSSSSLPNSVFKDGNQCGKFSHHNQPSVDWRQMTEHLEPCGQDLTHSDSDVRSNEEAPGRHQLVNDATGLGSRQGCTDSLDETSICHNKGTVQWDHRKFTGQVVICSRLQLPMCCTLLLLSVH